MVSEINWTIDKFGTYKADRYLQGLASLKFQQITPLLQMGVCAPGVTEPAAFLAPGSCCQGSHFLANLTSPTIL